MSGKKLAVPWILLGIMVIVCIALAVFIVIRDKETGEQPVSQNVTEDSSPNFQDYSDYESICKGYYMREDRGGSFILDVENNENFLIQMNTEDDEMFSEFMNGDVIMIATDNEMVTTLPPVIWVYQCMRIEKGTKERKSLPEIQEAVKELEEELGYTFEDYWRE